MLAFKKLRETRLDNGCSDVHPEEKRQKHDQRFDQHETPFHRDEIQRCTHSRQTNVRMLITAYMMPTF